MLDFTWKVFSMTGAIDTYLLLKELEKDEIESALEDGAENIEDHPIQ